MSLLFVNQSLVVIGAHFILFCITFFGSLFMVTYKKILSAKKNFFITIRSISILLLVSVIVQIWALAVSAATLVSDVIFRNDMLSHGLLIISTILIFLFFIIIETSLSYTKLSYRYLLEIPNLLLLLLVCLQLFITANELIVFVLSLELLTFLVLILLNFSFFLADNTLSLESSVKYFVFNGFSMGLLWLSLVGYYSSFNSLKLTSIGTYYLFFPELIFIQSDVVLLLHFLFFFSYLIKLGIGPVHFWVPDVYEGAETFMTAILVIVIGPILFLKFLLLLKSLIISQDHIDFFFGPFLQIIGALSIICGTLGSFAQTKIKRFLAFGGITHFGFMFSCLGQHLAINFVSVFLYLFFYILMNIIFFSLLLVIQRYTATAIIYFTQLRVLIFGNNILFYLALGTLLSFAGLPPFAGFFSKALVLYILVDVKQFGLLFFILCAILINIYLYLRILKIILFETVSTNIYISTPKTYYLKLGTNNNNKFIWSTPTKTILGILVGISFLLILSLFYLPTLTTLLFNVVFFFLSLF